VWSKPIQVNTLGVAGAFSLESEEEVKDRPNVIHLLKIEC